MGQLTSNYLAKNKGVDFELSLSTVEKWLTSRRAAEIFAFSRSLLISRH